MPVSSPRRYSFGPKSCRFRARIVHLPSPVRAVIEPFRAVSIRALAVEICCAAKLGDFFQQVSFSKHNRFDSWKLTHLERFVKKRIKRRREFLNVQSTEIDVMSMLFGLYNWTKGKRCPSTVGRRKYPGI